MESAFNHTRRFAVERLVLWSRQVKLPLSLAISAAAMTGFFLGPDPNPGAAVPVFLGVLVLSAGCAALNNYQDRDLDMLFERTRKRPLPSGRIRPESALVAALSLIGIGLTLLIRSHAAIGATGLLALCSYNFLYTPMKRTTLWALLPGVVCGMLPPLMGWVAAGGSPFRFEIVLLMMLFAVWQIPHFWLLILSRDDEFSRKIHHKPGKGLALMQIERILVVWVSCLACVMLCLPLAGLIRTPWILTALLTMTAAMLAGFFYTFAKSNMKSRSQGLFIILNSTVLLCLILIVTDRLHLSFRTLLTNAPQ